MTLVRHLTVARVPDETPGRAIRVAFASSDGESVDQHLAAATRFVVFTVSKATVEPVGIGEFATNFGCLDKGKLADKLAWLRDCDVVYAVAVGSTASMQLMARGVLPLRTPKGSSIADVLSGLQEQLDDSVAGWLEQVLHFKAKVASLDAEATTSESGE